MTITCDDPKALLDAVARLVDSPSSVSHIVVKFESKTEDPTDYEFEKQVSALASERGIQIETIIPRGSYTGKTHIEAGTLLEKQDSR